jgi:hypothetical protein
MEPEDIKIEELVEKQIVSSDKIIASKMATNLARLEVASVSERVSIKAQTLVDCELKEFEMDGYSVSFTTPPHVNGRLLECEISVIKDGKEIWIDNPVQFLNPPVNVPDGTTRKEIDEKGIEIEHDNMKFDPQEALKTILVRVVKHFDK